MKSYPDVQSALQDALRLAEGMTYKFALSGMAFGGGKTVIATPPDFDPKSRSDLLGRYGELVHQLGGLFYTGPDVGISSADMNIISETGSPLCFRPHTRGWWSGVIRTRYGFGRIFRHADRLRKCFW